MKAFLALVHRELIEHRGAFVIAPALLVAVIVVMTILAFTIGRVDVHLTGTLAAGLPLLMLFWPALILGASWGVYLFATLFFYCADGFAADKRNNAMLFWKSMPVSDFKILLSKLVAALTVLPGAVFVILLVSLGLMLLTAQIAMAINGTTELFNFFGLWNVFWNVSLISLTQLVVALLWYLPVIALVGAIAVAAGRWAIPIVLLLPALLSSLEWVTLGGNHPFDTHTWAYITGRLSMPQPAIVDSWIMDGPLGARIDSGLAYATDLIGRVDWMQVGIGAVFALLVLFLAAEYRRRAPAN